VDNLFEKEFPLTFKGLATFREAVVYVDLVKNEEYKQLLVLQSNSSLLFTIYENIVLN